MSIYSRLEEESIRDQALVTNWVRSRFLNPEQENALQAGLTVTVRRTNRVLRAVLAFFTVLIIAASAGLAMIVLDLRQPAQTIVLAVFAGVCFAIAWLLGTQGRLYRCGVEEAFSSMAVLLLAFSIASSRWEYHTAVALGASAVAAFAIYLVFGFRYAMVAAILFAGWVPFALKEDAAVERVLSLLILAIVFFLARRMHQRHRGEISGDDWTVGQVTAFAALYFVLNLVISSRVLGMNSITSGSFYWCTYVLTWVVPVGGVWLGIRSRDRFMFDAGALATLITITTNKPYLGWMRQTWDPILFGALLIGTAIGLRRWLVRSGKQRGFTPERILESEYRALEAASAISVALPNAMPTPPATQPAGMEPGGGQSGGGGASGSF